MKKEIMGIASIDGYCSKSSRFAHFACFLSKQTERGTDFLLLFFFWVVLVKWNSEGVERDRKEAGEERLGL